MIAWLVALALAADPLEEVLEQSPIIVRGRAGEPTAGVTPETAGHRYTPLKVTEVLKGTVDGPSVLVREPRDAPVTLAPGADLVVLLDAIDPEDEAYGLGGRYAIVSGRSGEWVPVNAAGVDADAVSSKDKHRRMPNHEVALDELRRLARAHVSAPAPVVPSPEQPPEAPARPAPPPEPPRPGLVTQPEAGPAALPALAIATLTLVAIALTLLALRRRR